MLDLNKKIKIEFEIKASDAIFLPIAIQSFVDKGGDLTSGMALSKDALERLSELAQEILNQFASKLSEVRINDKVEHTIIIKAEAYKVWEMLCFVLREKLNYLCDAPQSETDSFDEGNTFTFENGKITVDKVIPLQQIRLKHSLSEGEESFEIYLLNKTDPGITLTLCLEADKDYLYESLTDYTNTPEIVKDFVENRD